MRIVLDGRPMERDVTLVAVGNSTRYGGGMETLSVAVRVEQAGGRQGQSQSQS